MTKKSEVSINDRIVAAIRLFKTVGALFGPRGAALEVKLQVTRKDPGRNRGGDPLEVSISFFEIYGGRRDWQ